MLIKRVRQLLIDVRDRSNASFSGVGILVADVPALLPIMPLRPQAVWRHARSAEEVLTEVSDISSEFHDGFHVLSRNLDVLLMSQYFSPPLVAGIVVDPARRVGGRYIAALLGSALPGVIAAGVASATYGVAVFYKGQEVDTA
jgi:hypothetical protein